MRIKAYFLLVLFFHPFLSEAGSVRLHRLLKGIRPEEAPDGCNLEALLKLDFGTDWIHSFLDTGTGELLGAGAIAGKLREMGIKVFVLKNGLPSNPHGESLENITDEVPRLPDAERFFNEQRKEKERYGGKVSLIALANRQYLYSVKGETTEGELEITLEGNPFTEEEVIFTHSQVSSLSLLHEFLHIQAQRKKNGEPYYFQGRRIACQTQRAIEVERFKVNAPKDGVLDDKELTELVDLTLMAHMVELGEELTVYRSAVDAWIGLKEKGKVGREEEAAKKQALMFQMELNTFKDNVKRFEEVIQSFRKGVGIPEQVQEKFNLVGARIEKESAWIEAKKSWLGL